MLVGPEEALGAGEDVPDHHCGAEGVDDVLVVGVQQESVVDVAWMGGCVPEKPMTALICKSVVI